MASGISYRYDNHRFLFEQVSLHVSEGEKVSLIGSNGVGKSTLLRILAAELSPVAGHVVASSPPYYVPQQVLSDGQSVAEMIGVADKLQALRKICAGSVDPVCFEVLGEDWAIEERCRAALDEWGLYGVSSDTPVSSLSGGERTKASLAGLSLHDPEIVLLDEPTNHLDYKARGKLYDYIERTHATLVIVSHDITLLNLVNATCELTASGIRLYGGNYDFYHEQRGIEEQALANRIDAERAALRVARRRAQAVYERQERRMAQGERSKSNAGMARIIMNARGAQAQNSSARLIERHDANINDIRRRIADLRGLQAYHGELKICFDDSNLHTGKRLMKVEGMNFGYNEHPLWPRPFNLEIFSGDRIHIKGDNGSGKTTFVRLLLGELTPTCGKVERVCFSVVYLDQTYRFPDDTRSVLETAEWYNARHLPDHELKVRLAGALFPYDTWDKPCRTLSGGERMRLKLCCLMLSDHIPDLFVLDEPTNNLDIRSLAILTDTVRDYNGTLIVISHDDRFVCEIGMTGTLDLSDEG